MGALLAAWAAWAALQGATVRVSSASQFRDALRQAKAGDDLVLAAGVYEGGFYAANLQGTAAKPIRIRGEEIKNPPRLRGGATPLHFSSAAYLRVENLLLEDATANGINVDDGGDAKSPSHHIELRRLRISRIGPKGNHDGIKLSGIEDFVVEDCVVETWGIGSGSAVDMVGCRRGRLERNEFLNSPESGSGVQAKGGSSEITVRSCYFQNAGSRALNLGGSTGREYFRPALEKPPFAEARNLTVEGNVIVGSDAAFAFVGVDGATVRFNTIVDPGKWAIRILQETRDEGFVSCRAGKLARNLFIFRSDRWGSGGVNIGPGTAPETFEFVENYWFCRDQPGRSRPALPGIELRGVYGRDPKFQEPEKKGARPAAGSPAEGYGAAAWKP
ncbi:MAG: right-handed parallel beta-helix repeat-containing protein [Planctomycetes bacterium]|nr:right-handed parallel beta-helix repeat-containing protein [Planctomycetota bacterium]